MVAPGAKKSSFAQNYLVWPLNVLPLMLTEPFPPGPPWTQKENDEAHWCAHGLAGANHPHWVLFYITAMQMTPSCACD